MRVKVSVIVPVYNPGPCIEDCIASLLKQSLPPDEYEVIFVDDGSTDQTPARLDALAAEEPRVVAFAEWEAGLALSARPGAVEWREGSVRFDVTAEFTAGGTPLTFPGGGVRTPLDGPPGDVAEAVAWVGADTVARFGQATVDLLVRERSSAAQYFQPVEVTREIVPVEDSGQVRLVLRATATVDPAAAVDGGPLRAGLWDWYARVRLGGWNRTTRVGPGPRKARAATSAAVVGGRVVLPYWTDQHGDLSLDVDRANQRLGLGRLRGVHFADVPPGQAKYITCVRGAILDVVVDLRVGSPTFAQWEGCASTRTPGTRCSSRSLGHAFMALTEDATVVYLCSTGYTPGREDGVHPLDPDLGIVWPEGIPPVLSPKDAQAPSPAEARRTGLLPSYEACTARYEGLRGRPFSG